MNVRFCLYLHMHRTLERVLSIAVFYIECVYFSQKKRKIKMSQWEDVVQIKMSEILRDQRAAAKGGCVCLLGRVRTCKVREVGA